MSHQKKRADVSRSHDAIGHTRDGVDTALGMIEAAETQARNEMRAAEWTDCKACQSGLVIFLNDTPDADDDVVQAVFETIWETCPTCIAEYALAYQNAECEHGIQGWDNCDTCINAWADAYAPEDEVLDAPSDWEVQNGL